METQQFVDLMPMPENDNEPYYTVYPGINSSTNFLSVSKKTLNYSIFFQTKHQLMVFHHRQVLSQ